MRGWVGGGDHGKGRSRPGSQAYRTFLADGFLAGIRGLDGDVLTLEPFGRLTGEQRGELVEEAERMLTVLHGDEPYGIRFGTVAECPMERGRCEPLVAGSQRPLVSPEGVPQEPSGGLPYDATCAATRLEKVVSRV